MSVESDADDVRIDLAALAGAVLSRWLRILLVTAILVGITFIILMFMPRMYESSASLLVEPRENAFTRSVGEPTPSSSSMPESLMSSQIELVKSRDTLMTVIDSENLRSVPELTGASVSPVGLVMRLLGRPPAPVNVDEMVLANLADRLTVVRERDSAFISVIVRTQNPELSARVANAVARTHVQRRAGLSLEDTAGASTWLEQEIGKLRARVAEAETAVAEYRVGKDLFVGPNNTSLIDQQLANIANQITATQERKNSATTRATLIRGLLQSGQSLEGVQDVRNSAVVQQLAQSKAQLQGQVAQLSATLLDNHPTMRALRAQSAEIDGQIAAEARRVAAALEAEVRIEESLEASLRDDLARLKISASSATQNTVELEALEREAKAQRDLLESYLLRYREAVSRTEANSALPDVRVVTAAAPATSPSSPRTAFTLGAVAFVALALQVGAILFGELLSGRALTTLPRHYGEPVSDSPQRWEDAGEADLPHHIAPQATAEPVPEPIVAVATQRAEPAPMKEVMREPRPTVAASPERAAAAAAISAAQALPNRRSADSEQALADLSADIAIGRVRVLVLAALGGYRDCQAVADLLTDEALQKGLSVVSIDAGSGQVSPAPGLTDLSAETASFGDVVHKINDSLAEVPWGERLALDRRSLRPLTLVEALSDLYEVVIVVTGRLGLSSTLPSFAGLDCRLVLVSAEGGNTAAAAAASDEAELLGFQVAQIVSPPRKPDGSV